MKLYHFCPKHLLEDILKEGLTKGKTPRVLSGKVFLMSGTQWLTKDKEVSGQSWNTSILLPYNRAEVRLTVDIPESHAGNLFPARDFMVTFAPESADGVLGWEFSENWYVYRGEIRPHWIKKACEMEVH